MITLHAQNATTFNTLGLGALPDVITAKVTEERNGAFELEMTYPVDGRLFSSVSLRSIICAKPNPDDPAQPFRVYKITKPLNGIVTIYAQHISYDLSGYISGPFTASTIQQALAGLISNSAETVPFTLTTARTTSAAFSVKVPTSIRAALGGQSGSILDAYGGEWYFDRMTVTNYLQRGSNRGVVLEYGKNITDLKQEELLNKVYTAVYPFWRSSGEDDTVVTLPEKTIAVPGTWNFVRILALDLSANFSDQPSENDLRTAANAYITNNDLGVPDVSVTVSFINLRDTEEYKSLAALETVKLCDTITVKFAKLGVQATAKIIKTVYDAVGERFESISVGTAKNSLADTIARISSDLNGKPSEAQLLNAATVASDLITGNRGGYVRVNDSDGDGFPDEILVMDTADISTATKVWRWNLSGWGYSSTGYNGTYTLAATMAGEINADFIKAGKVQAAYINGTGLDVSNATIDNCTITALCTILGVLTGNTIASNTDGGVTGSLTFNQYGYSLEADDGTNNMALRVGISGTPAKKYAVLGNDLDGIALVLFGMAAELKGHTIDLYTDQTAGDYIDLEARDNIRFYAANIKANNSPIQTIATLKQFGALQEWQFNDPCLSGAMGDTFHQFRFEAGGVAYKVFCRYSDKHMAYETLDGTNVPVTDTSGNWLSDDYKVIMFGGIPDSSFLSFLSSHATQI